MVMLALLILLLAYIIGSKVQMETTERYENIQIAPWIHSAVPVGEDMTAIAYKEGSVFDGRTRHPPEEGGTFICLLDGRGRFIEDGIPLEGSEIVPFWDPEYSRESQLAIHGTDEGVGILYRQNLPSGHQRLTAINIPAVSGEMSEPQDPFTFLNISDFEFRSVSEGDTIHVVIWNDSGYGQVSARPNAVYARSLDGGISWELPRYLLDGGTDLSHVLLLSRDEELVVLLFDVKDLVRGNNTRVHMIQRSHDGGASFEDPVAVLGTSPPSNIIDAYGALSERGDILLKARGWKEGGPLRYRCIYDIDDMGRCRRIVLPQLVPTIRADLVPDPVDPLDYRTDVVMGIYADGKYGYQEYFDLDGVSMMTVKKDRPDPIVPFPTRTVGHRLQGIRVVWVSASHDCFPRSAGEIQLIELDPVKLKLNVVGKPYDVTYGHPRGEMAAFNKDIEAKMDVAWALLVIVLVSAFFATAVMDPPSKNPSPDRVTGLILVGGFAILMTIMVIRAMDRAFNGFDSPSGHLIIIGYGFLSVYLVEVTARTTDRMRYLRGFHVLFGSYIVLATGSFALDGMVNSGGYLGPLTLFGYMAWPVMVALSFLCPSRLNKVDFAKDGSHKWGLLSFWFLSIVIISFLFPFIANGVLY
jgi:hypothetical protein